MYSIDREDTGPVLRVKTGGLWTLDEVKAYAEDLRASAATARRRHGRLLLLVDSTDASVQPRPVADALQGVAADELRQPDDLIAVVVAGALKRMQVARTLPGRCRVFGSVDEAEHWLLNPDA